jgi:hypothetical protein
VTKCSHITWSSIFRFIVCHLFREFFERPVTHVFLILLVLFWQAKGEIKLTFSSTLSAPAAPPSTGGSRMVDHSTACPPPLTPDLSAVAVTPAMNARLHPASGWAPPSPMPAKRTATAADVGVHTGLSSTAAVVADVQTLSDADDIISEFLGQINADFSTSTAETVPATDHRSVQPPGSCQYPVGSAPSSMSSQQAAVAAVAVAGTDDRLFPLSYDRPTANRSAAVYGFPSYQRNHKEPDAVGANGMQRPVGAPFKPTTGSYTGYGTLPSYDLTIGDGHDLATGPAAETLKKMAAMHRSLYEKSASPPPCRHGLATQR